MAQSEELPIFKAAYDLLGQVYRANMSQEGRAEVLTDLLIDYRQLMMLLRVVYRQKAIFSGRYAELISLLDTIGRQATGWRQKSASPK